MGKRKRALSPKENVPDQQLVSSANIFKLKYGCEGKKPDSAADLAGGHPEKIEISSDKSIELVSAETDASTDDRPTPQLRISARVQNKQKREESGFDQQSSVIGSIKKVDAGSQDEDEEEEKSKGADGDAHIGDAKKRRRPWYLWSLEDKKTFFEALNECGKDFEAIQNFLLTKLRKKGIPACMIKNKDQVRHFYYRTWHKISKHINFSDDVKKSTQELYTLINYGELRRKVGGTLDEKKGQKLQELIQKGSTSVRIKGKNIRVRTPICRALKKLNEFIDDREQNGVRVPVTISVDIVPRSIGAWNHVQSLAHNPRVRISCSMHKTVASIIDHLQTKWKSTKNKLCDNLLQSATFPIDVPAIPPKFIRLRPPSLTSFNVFDIKLDPQVKSYAVSLTSHSQMLQRKGETELTSVRGKACKPRKKKCSTSSNSDGTKEKQAEESEGREESKEVAKEEKEGPPSGGEISQEETEGSDMEVEEEQDNPAPLPLPESTCNADTFDSSSNTTEKFNLDKDEEVVILSCYPPKRTLSNSEKIPPKPPPSMSDGAQSENLLPPNYEEEVLTAVKNIKEEVTDSMETLHQLLALENVANSQEIEEDADIICVGENTRLSANIREEKKKTEEQGVTGELIKTTQDQEESVKSPTETFAQVENTSVGGQTYSVAQCIDRAKQGWTAKTCGIITVGELFLLFGKKQQITLEYEFEDFELPDEITPANVVKASDAESENTPVPTEESAKPEGINEKGPLPSPVVTSSRCLSPSPAPLTSSASESGMASPSGKPISPEGEDSSQTTAEPSVPSDIKVSDDLAENKKKAAEDISSMMAKLLYMIKILSNKGATELGSCCCSGQLSKGPSLCHLRSPSNSRCLNGFLKSPGNTKSPRGCSVSMRSPRTPISGSAMSPGESLTPPPKSEKVKPASAKRLIAETSLEKQSNPPNPSSEASNSRSKEKSLESQGEKLNTMGVTPLENQATSGEFRVPIAPAPRNHGCQSPHPSFNAQLSKLLPRYSRPSRRSAWKKNIVVQRQLPLLPNLPNTTHPFNTRKELTIASASPRLPLPIVTGAKVPSVVVKEIRPAPPPIIVQQPVTIPILPEPAAPCVTQINNSFVTSNAISVNVSGHQLLTVQMPSYPISTSSVTTMSTVASITQSTTVSFATSDTLTVTTSALPINTTESLQSAKETYITSDKIDYSLSSFIPQTLGDSVIPYLSTPPSTPLCSASNTSALDGLLSIQSTSKLEDGNGFNGTNTSSLLSVGTIEIPSLSTPVKSSVATNTVSPPTSFSESSLLNTPTHLNTSVDRISSSVISPIKLNLSSFLSSNNSRSPDKSLDILLSNAPSEELLPQFHFPEGSDSLPILDISMGGTVSVKEQKTTTSDLPVSSIVGADISTVTAAINALSTVPSISDCSDLPSVPVGSLAAVPSIADCTNIPSVSPDISSLPTVSSIQSCGSLPSVSADIGGLSAVPHIVSCIDLPSVSTISSTNLSSASIIMSDELPVVTKEGRIPISCSNVLPNLPLSPESNTGLSLSVTCVTTSTTTSGSSCGKLNVIEESLLHSFQDSNDKMMDISLANSNSNSSFSSLLAAAANQPCLESIMENSLLQTPPRPLLSCSAKSNLIFDSEGFENISAVPLSPPSSPSRLLRQAETQWLHNEANDLSLSSLLSSLESPLKGAPPPPSNPQVSQIMHNLISTLNDNSVDFTATFARLKNQTKDKRE